MLPSSFFTSSTLTTLKLSTFNLKLPSRIQFPALKILEFSEITFCGDYLSNTLFSDSCCPMLEKLVLSFCNSVPNHYVTPSICATSIKSLKIGDNDGFYFTLSCPNLHELYFAGDKLPEISFETLSSLSIATFDLCSLPSSFDVMENLTMGMHNLHTLGLKGYYIEVWFILILDILFSFKLRSQLH
ncbi:hypothetical protein FRX31_020042 [Thalictrum thalictroides]|uniref:F-box/LRR-repeat protein 15/At3g58940/PEG3-like LRR domain-containing protein n=1 Tax=Thalictrum thalictroides TaxID=46969 RepID=A0A7J6W1I8_THATH|nr:hypothetical protein FRX31_020042 [Thalictrum thalictroides]